MEEMRTIVVKAITTKTLNQNNMSRFQWYRKLRGGSWYKNRYIINMGASVIFCWERTNKNGYTIEQEVY